MLVYCCCGALLVLEGNEPKAPGLQVLPAARKAANHHGVHHWAELSLKELAQVVWDKGGRRGWEGGVGWDGETRPCLGRKHEIVAHAVVRATAQLLTRVHRGR